MGQSYSTITKLSVTKSNKTTIIPKMCNCYKLQTCCRFPGLIPKQEGNLSELTDGWILTTGSSVERSLWC